MVTGLVTDVIGVVMDVVIGLMIDVIWSVIEVIIGRDKGLRLM